jgi:hypothetical protein
VARVHAAVELTDSSWLQRFVKGDRSKSPRPFCSVGVHHAKALFFLYKKILFVAASGLFNLYMHADFC